MFSSENTQNTSTFVISVIYLYAQNFSNCFIDNVLKSFTLYKISARFHLIFCKQWQKDVSGKDTIV